MAGETVTFPLEAIEKNIMVPNFAHWMEVLTLGSALTIRQTWQQAALLNQRFRRTVLEPSGPGEPTCIGCYTNKATRIFIPCGHSGYCSNCCIYLVNHKFVCNYRQLPIICPKCRVAVACLQRVYEA
jgi:hypothetical protein